MAASRLRGKESVDVFDVFLCYNSADRAQVVDLAARLRGFGLRPWLAFEQIRPGDRWQDAISAALGQIRTAAVLIGSSERLTSWQEREMQMMHLGGAADHHRVIPVMLLEARAGVELPPLLNILHAIDMRVADPDPIEQLRWAITGVTPRRI
jgi:hypothetical protein